MLKKTCADHPQEWDTHVPAVLFAYRGIPIGSLKFSPFELLYGRNVRGSLMILHELWSNEKLDEELRNSYIHVLELRQQLENSADIVVGHSNVRDQKCKMYFDRKTKPKILEVREAGLILLPTHMNKLIIKWKGHYKVINVKDNLVDYVTEVNGKPKLLIC